jgi:hypothetical protein
VRQYQNHLNPNHTFSAQAAMLHILLKIISPDSKWSGRLCDLMGNHPFISQQRMGFAQDWQSDLFWQ